MTNDHQKHHKYADYNSNISALSAHSPTILIQHMK